jgi:murein DD-endopeptidase MepM/ murein hydrolase activator NlpD
MERGIRFGLSKRFKWTGYRKNAMKYCRPVDERFPVSAEYGRWGTWWTFHTIPCGIWVPGKVEGKGQHKGIDFATPVGTEVFAMADGFILLAGWENDRNPKQGFGLRIRQQIEIDGKPHNLVYGHLSALTVRTGNQVARGDRIGYSGDTGRVSGPHLHVELTDGRGQYYPLEFDNSDEKIA